MTRLLDRVPLRVKLVAALLALVALGLVATGAAATAALRGYLVGRVDEQLKVAAPPIVARIERGVAIGPRAGQFQLPSDFLVRLSTEAAGALAQGQEPTARRKPPPPPVVLSWAELGRHTAQPFTVAAQSGDTQWRVITLPVEDQSAVITVGVPLDGVQETVRRLLLLETLVGLLVLGLLGGLGYVVVRTSLKPLAEVETTAAAIAAGDLTRRVPEHDPHTEVGRLARAFNAMVARIEAAFSERERSAARAQASEERMRRFIADASHELRTPLTSIRGFSELYRQGAASSPEDVARIMRRVEDEAARMGLLVEDLLLLARLDQQRPLERRPVDLLALCGDAVHDARAAFPDHPIELRVTGELAPVVQGDEARLRQVLGNLVSNAMTHTPPGTPVLVGVGVVDGSVVLSVRDAGPGMSSEDAARVFERFFRVDAARTRTAGGTGLGLSIVAALVAAHGGTVGVETAPGQGATFVVRLPLVDAPVAAVPALPV